MSETQSSSRPSSTKANTSISGSHDLEKGRSIEDLEKGGSINKSTTANSAKDDKPKKLVYVPFVGRKQPREPYASLDEAPLWPQPTASLFSKLTFTYIQPLLILGYQRTLGPLDLWKLNPQEESGYLADRLMENFDRRKIAVEVWNAALADGSYKPTFARKSWWKVKKSVFGIGTGDGKNKVGLAGALSDTFFRNFWSGGVIKIFGDVAQVTSPLVTKALINFATQSYYARQGIPGYTMPSVGLGVGLAFALWGMQVVYAISIHQFFARSAGTGVLARAALIAALYRKAVVLSGKSRVTTTNGKLINHISTDVSRIDFCCGFFHISWSSCLQIIIIIILLVINLGPSSLAGVAFLLVVMPAQGYAMKKMFALRRKAMIWTDQRAKLMQELLGGMRIIKFFAWELPYLTKINKIRKAELKNVRVLLVIRALNSAVAMSVPMLATVIAFLVYASLEPFTSPAIIFTSLTFFNLLRMPLMMLPMALATITDAYNGLERLTVVFLAEEISGSFQVDPTSEYAIQVNDASFIWETAAPPADPKDKKAKKIHGKKSKSNRSSPEPESKPALVGTATTASIEEEAQILQLSNINIKIPKGALVGVVGSVGSGKSSLLQALIGEIRRTKGEVIFSGSIAYCPQQSWIRNCTLRENIIFGQPVDEARYQQVVRDACLKDDLAMLPNGDETEIGEKGINLSGGQKQRVSIARALYFDSDTVLLDDPLSAVDAHVGEYLFHNAICGALKNRTRILVTHGLQYLPACDYIISIEEGKITQQGTYEELMLDQEGGFAQFIAEYGSTLEEEKKAEEAAKEEVEEEKLVDATPKKRVALMQEEERATGTVTASVYRQYFAAANGRVTLPLLFASLVLMQASQVLGAYWLIFWQEDQFNKASGFYMGIYAFLGIVQAFASFLLGLSGVYLGYNASKSLFSSAATGVLFAPMSFFDTTPLGRIMNRFSKDIDTLDNTLNDSIRMAMATFASVLGAIILVTIVNQYFLLFLALILSLYLLAALFYTQSARELKGIDNVLRSSLYGFFSETLSGLATIRAYGETAKFQKLNERFIDIENRAYYLTVFNQRWLGIRLDFFGSLLVLVVALVGVVARFTISPSQTGLILAYILTIQGAFSWMIRQGAEVQNDLNSVERLLYYGKSLEQEAPAVIESNKPESNWPENGSIELDRVVMSYRRGLPAVLKGMSMSVAGGEKIGVIGRTGAGKSSIMLSLFRIVELSSGTIKIDGIDISKIGLRDLRARIAIIPQDALLFNGTIRSNLDPFGEFDDARLWDALKRSYLVDASFDHTAASGTAMEGGGRFTLDLPIEDEGLNLSVGERSLVSLARALVKDSKIIILDEATASVDYATDSKIQETIHREFKSKTLLTIAHRIKTILNYDRVLVMNAGTVEEFDTPLNLFRKEGGAFREMCLTSGLGEDDIVQARTEL